MNSQAAFPICRGRLTTTQKTHNLSEATILADLLREGKPSKYTVSTPSKSEIFTTIPAIAEGSSALTYTLNGDATAGDVIMFTIVIESKNYANFTLNVTITLGGKQTPPTLTLTANPTTVAVGETVTLSTTGGYTDGVASYSITEGTDKASISGSTLTARAAGTVKVKATMPENDTYLAAVSDEVPITITGGDQTTPENPGNTDTPSHDNNDYGDYGSSSDSASGGGSGSGATVAEPSTSGGSTTVEMTTSSTTSGTTAKAEVRSSDMNKAVNSAITEAAKNGTSPVVEIEVKTSSRADSLNVSLPRASLETLADTSGSTLIISSDVATVELDHTALSALADRAAGSTVSLQVAPVETYSLTSTQRDVVGGAAVVDLSLVSGGAVIHDYDNGRITVTLPYELPAGVSARDVVVYYLADDGSVTPCSTSYAGGQVTFITNHLSKYVIADAELANRQPTTSFTDVPANAYYADAVAWALENGVTEGIGNNAFGPNFICTRAQIVTFLWRAKGKPAPASGVNTFTDVDAGAYYYDAVLWAVENGITTGDGDSSTFNLNGTCTRAQIVTFLWRANNKPSVTATTVFPDVEAGSYYADAVSWAVAKGVTTGDGDGSVFNPNSACTRAQCVTFLYRAK